MSTEYKPHEPPVMQGFPIKFDNGYKWHSLHGHCAHCNTAIIDKFFTGTLSTLSKECIDVRANGYCCYCEEISNFRIRIYDDGKMMQVQNGTWKTFEPDPPLFESIKFFKKYFINLLLFK